MAVIRVLDKHTAELIAAGEVVERPSSVAKELLENAIDAGATQITVAIESGGVKLIEVSDNGTGIEPEYISTAFIRHATSKIAGEDDLTAIHTLGFRGEALASIASVARVEVLTRTEQSEFAVLYRNEGGEEQPVEPAARAVGTTIRVRDLFYNTPARMKFLKKDATEGTYVAEVAARLALSHPEVSFKFIREGKTQYVTPGDGDLRGAVYAVLGREFARDLLPVSQQEGLYRLQGLITPPRACRASRSMQYFYINGRYVYNRTMMAGLEMAFKGTTMQGKFPGGVLMLEMPAELVDVNVHPAKTEVRFARENDVFNAVYHIVKLALASPGSGEQRFVLEKADKSLVIPHNFHIVDHRYNLVDDMSNDFAVARQSLHPRRHIYINASQRELQEHAFEKFCHLLSVHFLYVFKKYGYAVFVGKSVAKSYAFGILRMAGIEEHYERFVELFHLSHYSSLGYFISLSRQIENRAVTGH